ncbi:hypothetical protein VE03_06310 [Pseudogymnoascus sp. 23342-1-I1]|nr:hypothetical protein VE03_06310 [Pseudogymnoascus sp. 23342-1-I1]
MPSSKSLNIDNGQSKLPTNFGIWKQVQERHGTNESIFYYPLAEKLNRSSRCNRGNANSSKKFELPRVLIPVVSHPKSRHLIVTMPARKASNKPARNYAGIRKSTSPKRTSVSLRLHAALQTDNIDNPGSITEHPDDAISHWIPNGAPSPPVPG